jgi:hypothetical protein
MALILSLETPSDNRGRIEEEAKDLSTDFSTDVIY